MQQRKELDHKLIQLFKEFLKLIIEHKYQVKRKEEGQERIIRIVCDNK